MKEVCANFENNFCKAAKVPVVCGGFKDVCPFPELYKEALSKGMVTSDARKRLEATRPPTLTPAINNFAAPYSNPILK